MSAPIKKTNSTNDLSIERDESKNKDDHLTVENLSKRVHRVEHILCGLFVFLFMDRTAMGPWMMTKFTFPDLSSSLLSPSSSTTSTTSTITTSSSQARIPNPQRQFSKNDDHQNLQSLHRKSTIPTSTRTSNTTTKWQQRDLQSMFDSTSTGTSSMGMGSMADTNVDNNVDMNVDGSDDTDMSNNIMTSNSTWNITHHCHKRPILTPINEVNDFIYDERVDRILNTLRAISSTAHLDNQLSPQYKAACWLLFDDEREISPENKFLIQRYVQAMFLFSTYEDAVHALTTNFCENDNFGCDSKGHVTWISLIYDGVKSTIPTEISHLRFLERLSLSGTRMQGTIPAQLGLLPNLRELYLEENELTGTIPTELGMLSNLENLLLDNNKFEGNIPSEFGSLTNLKRLKMHDNKLHGTFPSEVFKCVQLIDLYVYNNHLTGTIPTEIHQIREAINIYFDNNQMSGQIPSEIGLLPKVETVRFGANILTGKLPQEIASLTTVTHLVFDENHFTGSMPDVFRNLTRLDVINLSHNELSGSIPESMWNVDFNTAVILDHNDLTGSVPNDFCADVAFFKVDIIPWFVDYPKVECNCCEFVDCYIWNSTEASANTLRPQCPDRNKVNLAFDTKYWVIDNVAKVSHVDFVGFGSFNSTDICLSPTGCYTIFDIHSDHFNTHFSYSSSSKTLEPQEQCDAVEVCGVFYDMDNPKRKGLNHLTQLIFPDISILDDPTVPESRALCWIMNEDPLFFDFHICDGTLLQRYIMALFFLSQDGHSDNDDDMGSGSAIVFHFNKYSVKDTCEWPGISCDDYQHRFVERLELPNNHLQGSITETIGHLTRLRVLDLSGNEFTGTISPNMFVQIPHLEVFNVGDNRIRGDVPKELLLLPNMKYLNISNNKFNGELPDNIEYARKLEKGIFGHNLLQGSIPNALIACDHLRELDLSLNGFTGLIPTEINLLNYLEVIKLNENMLSGTIPLEIFNHSKIEVLMLQANEFTGSIPTEIGTMENVKQIVMSYNMLKGNVPDEIQNLKTLERLHLHHNSLTGEVPIMDLPWKDLNSFITDCGKPWHELPQPLQCKSCTICCNSEDECQENSHWGRPLILYIFSAIGIPPFIIAVLAYIIHSLDKVDVEQYAMGTDDINSVYHFSFSNNVVAWLIYLFTAGVQIWLFRTFLGASDLHKDDTAWQYTIRCPSNSIECQNDNSVDVSGWFLFSAVTSLYLGKDFANSMLQIKTAVVMKNAILAFSGVALLSLTTMAVFTSVFYNMALAETNTDLIVNAVILLFINDLDEQFMALLRSMFPTWTENRMQEINLLIEKIKTRHQEHATDLSFQARLENGRRMLGFGSIISQK